MAVSSLSLLESLRPWRFFGITHFLGTPQTYAPSSTTPPAAYEQRPLDYPDADAAGSTPLLPSQGRSLPADAGTSAPSGQSPSASNVFTSNHEKLTPESQPLSSLGMPQVTKEASDAPSFPPVGAWPEDWQSLYHKTRPAPLVWTYQELGQDLLGEGNPQRSSLLKSLIQSLRLQKGTSTFWPLSLSSPLPASAAQQKAVSPSLTEANASGEKAIAHSPDAYWFSAGVQLLQPKALLLFGIDAVRLTGTPLSLHLPFTQELHSGVLWILLPDFPALIASESLAQKTSTYLRTALSGIPGLLQ